ncbi:27 kDa antigen Cfp30B [Arthrobacter sp. Hiyo4]|nr:27 kDa antigen Cfp30B [Arthrobacter sp. Hiyo4]
MNPGTPHDGGPGLLRLTGTGSVGAEPLKLSEPGHRVVPVATHRQKEQLFGWDYETGDEEKYGGYTTARRNGRTVAGLMQKDEDQAGTTDVWSTYLRSDDAEATASAVAANGGQVFMPPMDVPEQGHMAIFGDAAGAAICVWQPREMKGYGLVAEPGAAAWHVFPGVQGPLSGQKLRGRADDISLRRRSSVSEDRLCYFVGVAERPLPLAYVGPPGWSASAAMAVPHWVAESCRPST